MTNNFYPTIFAPVKANETPPDHSNTLNILVKGEPYFGYYSREKKNWYTVNGIEKLENIEWLEPLTNRYVFTKEELEERDNKIKNDWKSGIDRINKRETT